MARRPASVFLSLLLFFGLALSLPARLQAQERAGSWLDEVDSLITPREREAFLGLASDADRQAFIQRFWQVRDPYPETDRNEARERWEARLREARRRWSEPRDDRARIFLLRGDPSGTIQAHCAGIPLEVWSYEPRFQVKHLTMLVFTSDGNGAARIWHPGDAPDLTNAKGECAAVPALARAAMWVRLAGRDGYATLVKRALSAPKPREWVSGFKPPSAEVRRQATALAARLDVDFPGRRGDGLVRVLVEPLASVEDAAPAPGRGRELIVSGRVLRGGETVDSFRYRFDPRPAAAGPAPLAFERRLPPGLYTLKVELDSPALGRSFVGERELVVPGDGEPAALEAAASAAVPAALSAAASRPAPEVPPEVRRVFAEADASLTAPRPGLRILAPRGNLLAGTQRFEARIDGGSSLPAEERIERVAFSLDGRPVLTRNRPPYIALLDLGPAPRPRRLTVEGLSRRGEVLAADELAVNAGAQRFAVRIVEPRPGRVCRGSLRARVEVEAPADRGVERVELYLGDSRAATLYQPPFVQPLVLPEEARPGYVRAVAFLTDGTAAEDLVLLNAPAATETMDIRLVELYANVVDRSGRPVEGIAPAEFQVFEDGVRQSVRLVERVQDTPLRLVTLIDNSASMQPRLEASRQAALQFLRRTLRPRDEAAVITFNRAPRVAAGLTGDLAVLEEGLSELVAEEETSLYDSLLFSLYYLGGAPGQRAVLLLSDGQDRTSGFRFEDALESARRAGIAVYAIGIDLPRGEASQRLARLAEETGGRSFFLGAAAELDRAYQEIERDLRSRYRISYQSSNTRPGEAFRGVRVQVARQGLEARTISGYYP